MSSYACVGAPGNSIMEMAASAICMDERIGVGYGVDSSRNTFDRRIVNAVE